MSMGEALLRLLAEMRPLLPGAITVVVITLLLTPILHYRAGHAWLQSGGFSLAGLFFGLSNGGVVSLACAWIKLIFPVVYLISFQKPVMIQFIAVAVPGLVVTLLAGSPAKIGNSLLYLALELIGLLCAGLICGYIQDVGAGRGFVLVYIAISVFLVLFGLYTFMTELENISAARRVSAAEVWGMTEDEFIEKERE